MSDTVFNLANGIDVEEMKQKVEKYKRENQALIMKNRARQVIHVCAYTRINIDSYPTLVIIDTS